MSSNKTYIQNIVGGIAKSDLSKISESTTINMFVENVDGKESYVNTILRPCPGMKTICEIDGTPRGMFTVSRGVDNIPQTYAVFDNKLYIIYKNTPYEIGTMANSYTQCHFCETGGYGSSHPHLIIVDGINVYAVNTGKTIADQITDFRTIRLPYRVNTTVRINPTHCAYLYGYLVVNDSGTDAFYTSYQYPFESYSETESEYNDLFRIDTEEYKDYGFITYSEWQPDNTLALCSNGSRLFTFGERSYQMFQYNNDVNNPFNSPDTAAQMIGIKAINSLAQLGKYTLWLGSSDLGNNGIYMNTGNVESTRVSTTNIERIISNFSSTSDAIGQIWQDNQHIFYTITFPSANKTFTYDITTGYWSEKCSLDTSYKRNKWRYQYATMNNKGKIWYQTYNTIVESTDEDYNEHDGTPILRLRRGGVIYNNYNNFYIDSIEVITNNGQYKNVTDRDVHVTMTYSVDGSTFNDKEIINIGKVGEYDYDCVFYNFGMGKEFIIELSCTDNVPFSLYGLKLITQECKW